MRHGAAALGVTAILLAGVNLRADTPSQDPAAPIRVTGSIQAPKKTRDVAPVYPAEAQRAGVQGIVVLEVTVGPDGRVTNVRPVRSIPPLDEAAMDAVRQWEFTPTLLNGVPVPILMTLTVNFTLDGAGAADARGAPVGLPATAALSTGVPACLQTTSETAAQAERRQLAIRFLEEMHARQRTIFIDRQGMSYARLEEIAGLVPPPGLELQLVANEQAYSVSLKDTADACSLAFFSDQQGVIYMTVPVR